MWIPVEVAHVAYGPATPSTAAVPQNLSTNYGGPRLMETDTVQNFPFGYIVRAFDPIHGYGEFMYLQGVASTVAGSRVTYVPHTGVTTLGDATANSGLPTAFAVAPCTAGLFGWYQVAGTALAVNNATAAVGTGKIAASGAITSSAVTGGQILGGTIVTANGTTFTKTGTTKNGSPRCSSQTSMASMWVCRSLARVSRAARRWRRGTTTRPTAATPVRAVQRV
jgi:hypothetical protein